MLSPVALQNKGKKHTRMKNRKITALDLTWLSVVNMSVNTQTTTIVPLILP